MDGIFPNSFPKKALSIKRNGWIFYFQIQKNEKGARQWILEN